MALIGKSLAREPHRVRYRPSRSHPAEMERNLAQSHPKGPLSNMQRNPLTLISQGILSGEVWYLQRFGVNRAEEHWIEFFSLRCVLSHMILDLWHRIYAENN